MNIMFTITPLPWLIYSPYIFIPYRIGVAFTTYTEVHYKLLFNTPRVFILNFSHIFNGLFDGFF